MMTRFVFDYWMDGYDTEEEMIEACKKYIYDQLNFTASGVGKISTVDDRIQDLQAQLEELLLDRGRRDAKIAVLTSVLAKLARDGQQEYAQKMLKKSDEAWMNVKQEDLVVAHVQSITL